MGDTTKVRLVRCPRCENLLPELTDYSVYQCGGCGAVLRAKKKGNVEGNKGLEKCDEEKVGVVAEKSVNLSENSEDLVEKKRVSVVENKEVRVSNNSEGIISETVPESFGVDSRKEVSKGGVEVDDVNLEKNEVVGNGSLESKVDKVDTHVDNGNGVRKSSRVIERNLSDIREEDRLGRSRPSRRGYFEELRSSSSNYVGEGPSNYKREVGGGTKVEDMEPDREELLRKLEELKDQLSRAQNRNDKIPTEGLRKAPHETYVEPEDYFRDHPSTFRQVSRQFSAANKHVTGGAPYMDHYHDPFARPERSDIGTHGYHPSIHGQSYIPRYEDRLESSQMFRRPPPQRIPSHLQYMRPELDHFEPPPYDMTLGHISCSCYRCYDRQHQLPPQSDFGNRRFPHVPNNPVPCHRELHGAFGSRGYNSRIVNAPPLGSCEPNPNTRWPSDRKQERNACARPRRVVLANGHRYRPVAGGAPFVTCRNCFELLTLPKNVFSKMGEWQISCAACSTVISFAVVDEKLVSIDALGKQTNVETLGGVNEMAHGYLKRDNGSYCSEDYANSVYDFQAMDRDPASSFTGHAVSSSKSEEMHNIHSVSATTSEDDPLSDDLGTRQEVTYSAEPPENTVTSPPSLGSPPQDPFDYTSKYRAVNRCGKGNLSSRSDQERVTTNKNTLRQNSLKESLATEMEISPNEYANTKISKDVSEKCREDDQPKGKKGDSFLAGILKKSFRSNQTVESAKKNVMVNGHLIPDRLVKKAEKLAGPVYPGQYWYDYRAGFWGVVGGPCLGIVPPSIEEFNYPMPENCAAGNTGVFVNGRELHQKDLELLSSRGLPASKDRSYIVEITGRVVDEDTGKELDSLGKLAPTVEKVKHGFGMRAPKAVS
ncbi:hypothetical protein RND81_01G190500 [Saponaria officinalis]|uniref:Zinc-ribbon domain-containing protein n=1 Tax=Saponaria officinalis TaxID=3572 RepID=A0AAW1N8N8_SAPOF